jgi:Mg-chelatase subunit ChlD
VITFSRRNALILVALAWLGVRGSPATAAVTQGARVGPHSPAGAHVGPLAADDLTNACGSPNPFLVTSRFPDNLRIRDLSAVPVVFAFRSSADGMPADVVPLATYAQVGTAYGLAFDPSGRQLYAATFVKRGALFPAGGPGAIERIDLATGTVTRWATVGAGPVELHRLSSADDAAAAAWVGRAGFGDIDLDAVGSDLFAANLFDGRIWHLTVPDGTVRGSFAHGGAGAAWASEARPFGLAVRDDRVFHGVVEPPSASRGITVPIGHIYSSAFDGADLREVATFPLDPAGDDAPRIPWEVSDRPVVSDIDFRADGSMTIAVRNLNIDADIGKLPPRLGDLLPAVLEGDRWRAVVAPERYDDSLGGRDEALTGGIAVLPGLDLVVAAGLAATDDLDTDTAAWFGGPGDGLVRVQALGAVYSLPPLLPGEGDVEVLCAPDTPLDPDRVASATADVARIATSTAVAAAATSAARLTAAPATMTAVAPTLTAYAPTQADLATTAARQTVSPARATTAASQVRLITDACESDDPYFAVAHAQAVRRNRPAPPRSAVTAFNRAAPLISLVGPTQVGSIYGLAYDSRRRHLYAAAFEPSEAGPGGAGAIYRIDLDSGRVAPWAVLPVRRAVKPNKYLQSGIGDIDLDDSATEIFAVNLSDRRIYRFSVPEGALLGVFAHGATGESWAAQAYPFALGYRDGWLFHGVVPDVSRTLHTREVVIYRSRSDGTEMSEVARFALNYRMPGQQQFHSSALLVDIAFGAGGAPVLGLRDGTSGLSGDLVPAVPGPNGWAVTLDHEHYADRTAVDEAVTGGLAPVPGLDRVVAAAAGLRIFEDMGALWSDNRTGAIADRRVLAPGKMIRTCDPMRKCSVLSDYDILGDLEALCPIVSPTATPVPTPTSCPTPTDTPTLTPSPTNTPTPTPSATVTPRPTGTSTPSPRPLYLPVLLNESCRERKIHTDVALVIDTSTSMRNHTRDGRSKLDAVQDAARAFVALMDFAPEGGHDQVAVAVFNDRAWLAQTLGNDLDGLRAAIDRLPEGVAPGTRLDLAIDVGLSALSGAGRITNNTPVLVLLTDGLPNRVPLGPGGTQEETVVAAADRAKAAGVHVYTIGVGQQDATDPADRINADLLRAVATEPAMFFQTVDAAELGRIYADIAYTLGCPPESFWGGRR